MQFATENAVRMTIDESGNVGIGTTAPGVILDIDAGTASTSQNTIRLKNGGWSGPGSVSAGIVAGTKLDLFTASDNSNQIGVDGSGNLWYRTGGTQMSGFQWYTASDNSSSPTLRMSIANDGSVGIGAIVPDVALDVAGSIEYTGTITDVSDRRLKTDIVPLSADEVIARLARVETYSFRMKDDEEGVTEFGVMAQEIEEIFPELVRTADDEMGTKSVNYVGLIAPMITAVQDLQDKNAALSGQVEDVQAMLGEMRAEMDAMKGAAADADAAEIADDARDGAPFNLILMLVIGGMGILLIGCVGTLIFVLRQLNLNKNGSS